MRAVIYCSKYKTPACTLKLKDGGFDCNGVICYVFSECGENKGYYFIVEENDKNTCETVEELNQRHVQKCLLKNCESAGEQ